MLILIAGGSVKERADARHEYAPVFDEIDPAQVSVEELASMAGTLTLTGESRAFFMRGIFSASADMGDGEELVESFRDQFLDIAKGLAESSHLFVCEEEKAPNKSILTRLTKAGAELRILVAPLKTQPFEIFSLANALQRRNRKELWLGLVRAEREGISPENVAGVLAWKARTLRAFARERSEQELFERLSRELVCLYHDSHRGMGELSFLLERFALTL